MWPFGGSVGPSHPLRGLSETYQPLPNLGGEWSDENSPVLRDISPFEAAAQKASEAAGRVINVLKASENLRQTAAAEKGSIRTLGPTSKRTSGIALTQD